MPTRKWGVEKLVNTTTANNQAFSRVTALSNGRFVVVWQDHSGAHQAIRGQLFDATGNKIGGEIAIDVAAGNDEVFPQVTGLDDGSFYVAWTQLAGTTNSILGNVYDANGSFVRSQNVSGITFPVDNAAVAPIGDWSVAVWEQTNGSNLPGQTGIDIGLQVFNQLGMSLAPVLANSTVAGDQTEPKVATQSETGLFAVVWLDQKTGIAGRLFDSKRGYEEFHVSPQTLSGFTVGEPDVTWLNDLQFAVTWLQLASDGSYDIEARVLNAVDHVVTPATDVIPVNGITIRDQTSPTITALPDGDFVVAWQDKSGTGMISGTNIKLQAFDPSGYRIGGETTVNTTLLSDQTSPSVAALADGRVVVSWTDYSQSAGDISGSAIRMQIIDPRDGIVTGTGKNDTLYGHDQVNDEISGGPGNDTMYGLGGDDSLYGGEGNDALHGGKGADFMVGGVGNDTYYVDNADDTVIENLNEGTDTVYASVSYTLAAGTSVQYLRANAGSIGLTLTGNELDNTIVGGKGADTMIGGTGNDTFYVDNAGDIVTEKSGEGSDTVYANVNYTLGAGQSIQFLRANAGSTGLTLTGNEFDNTIVGGTGSDTLIGGKGNDMLQGGAGADMLTGGIGADKFTLATLADSTVASPDAILDFSTPALDKIDLHLMDANASLAGDQAFSFVGTSAFAGMAGQLHYAASGGNTLISGDVNGDKTADFSILANGAHTFSASDFVL